MVTRIPAHEVFQAAAWFLPPFLLLLTAAWAAVAHVSNRRAARFAAEDNRIDEQARAERQAARRLSQTPADRLRARNERILREREERRG